MPIGYLRGCKKIYNTRLQDFSANDFKLTSGTLVANGANWDIPFTLKPVQIGGDVLTILSCASADLYTSTTALVPTATLVAPSGGLPTQLNTTYLNIPQNPANTGNTWKIKYNNLEVRAKNDSTFTIPSLIVLVKSPF